MDVGVSVGLGDGLGDGVGVMLSDGVSVEGDDVGDGLGLGLCCSADGDQPNTPK